MKRLCQSLAGQNRDPGVGVSFIKDSEDKDEVRDQQTRTNFERRSHQPADIIFSMAKAEVGLHMYSEGLRCGSKFNASSMGLPQIACPSRTRVS